MEDRKNEWVNKLRMREYEPVEEDFDIDDFRQPPLECLDEPSDEEVGSTGWEDEDNPNNSVDEKQKVSKKAVKGENNGGNSRQTRKKYLCPIKGCKSQVRDLPRHLRDVHKWAREKAKKATSRFGMRESFSSTNRDRKGKDRKWKDYHYHRKCPISGCHSIVKRLSQHLRQVHKEIRKGSSEYKAILKEARPRKPSRSSALVSRRTEEAEISLSSNSDNNSVAGTSVKGDGNKDSGTENSDSISDGDNCGYEGTPDSDSQTEAESTGNLEMSHGIFGSFISWLQTTDGGRKPHKMSKQHASQVEKILTVIDPNKDLASLFDRKLIRDTFLRDHAEKTYKPDTIKSYLLSLRYFCSFVLTERPEGLNVDDASINVIDEKARLWSTSYKKDCQRRHLEKQDEDISNLITAEMVTTFEQSESTRRAVSLIGQLSGAHCIQLNQEQYTLIRDFILTEMTIANAHRSGVLANMTIGEFNKSKHESNGSYVISVKNHKTASIHGPARVVLSPKLFGYLKVYVNEVRSVVNSTKDENDSVILSWSGAKVVSGQISTAINAAWKKAGLEGHISSTLFRKSAVTAVHTSHKDMTGKLADLMAHKESTAQRYYKLHEKQKSCVEAAAELPSIMRTTKKVLEGGDSITTMEEDIPAGTKDSTEKHVTWNKQQIEAIRELFREEIDQKSVTMALVREKITHNAILCNHDPKKICDRVRSEWRHKRDESHLETAGAVDPPDEEETFSDKMSRYMSSSSVSEFVPPSNSSYVSRNLFSLREKEDLLRLFKPTIKSGIISKPAVKNILEEDEAGRQFLKKFTVDQIVNRLKYERRMNQKRT